MYECINVDRGKKIKRHIMEVKIGLQPSVCSSSYKNSFLFFSFHLVKFAPSRKSGFSHRTCFFLHFRFFFFLVFVLRLFALLTLRSVCFCWYVKSYKMNKNKSKNERNKTENRLKCTVVRRCTRQTCAFKKLDPITITILSRGLLAFSRTNSRGVDNRPVIESTVNTCRIGGTNLAG